MSRRKGKLLTEGELKSVKKVYLEYQHPDPSQPNYRGVAFVRQFYDKSGCYLTPRHPDSPFSLDWTYGEEDRNDKSNCETTGFDGDTIAIFEYKL